MGELLAVLSVICTATMPIVNKFVLKDVDPFEGAMLNAGVAALAFILIDWIFNGRPSISISRHAICSGVFNGVGLAAMFSSLERIHPIVLAFASRTGVIFAMILSVLFLKQRPKREEIILAVFAIAGALVAAMDRFSESALLGLVLALSSAFAFSVSNLGLKLGVAAGRREKVLAETNVVSTFVLLTLFFIFDEPLKVPGSYLSWCLIIGGSLMGSCLGFWLYLASLKYISFPRASLPRAAGPLFTAILAWPFFGLELSLIQVTTSILMLIGILYIARVGQLDQVAAVRSCETGR